MSNFRAIAAVTETMKTLIQNQIQVPEAVVTTLKPNNPGPGAEPRVNLYLYQVAPNASLRNQSLPTTSASGKTVYNKPQVALDLHYLLTFYGDEANLVPQKLLASVVSLLNAEPTLSPSLIDFALRHSEHPDLVYSGLIEQPNRVRVTPMTLNLEQLSKLWSVFLKVEYSLSAIYVASVVLIDADVPVSEALPVRKPELYVVPQMGPQLLKVTPASGETGHPVTLEGRNLSGRGTTVHFGAVEAEILHAGERTIQVKVPEAPAGLIGVRVTQTFTTASGASFPGFKSGPLAFSLVPKILDYGPDPVTAGAILSLTMTPPVVPGQSLYLILEDQVLAPLPISDEPSPDRFQFRIPPETEPGSYLVRLRVDGVESRLRVDQHGYFDAPSVDVIAAAPEREAE